MKNLSIQKFSMLSLILIAVSAVTAAVLPSNNKSDASRFVQLGSFTASDDNVKPFTCTPTANIATGNTCIVTAGSGTAGVGIGSISNVTTVDED